MTAPVLLVFYSRTRMPESGQLADDVATRRPRSSRAASSPASSTSTPPRRSPRRCRSRRSRWSWSSSTAGRLPLLQDVAAARRAAHRADPGDAAAHHAGHHRAAPAARGAPVAADEDGAEPQHRPALRPRPGRARRGRHRPRGRGVPEARRRQPRRRRGRRRAGDGQGAPADPGRRPPGRPAPPPRPTPTTSTPRPMVADLDMLGGHVDDAFNRLVDAGPPHRRATSATRRREHLLGLFGAVGNDDPRVLRGPAEPRLRALLSARLRTVHPWPAV